MHLGRWTKALCPKIGISNEVSSNESLAFMHVLKDLGDWIFFLLAARIERESP
jgi:hypothetical protein